MPTLSSSHPLGRQRRSAVPIRALILDVDGTMYVQRPVRLAMAWRLACGTVGAPRQGARWWRVLRAYRDAQEELRDDPTCTSAGAAQLERAVERSGVPVAEAHACVERWMHAEPCGVLARHRRPGLVECLRAARAAGLAIGVFSDYPAERKLVALGVRELVDVVRSAHDVQIARFKPSPAGLLHVAAELGVAPHDCHYVGDRPEVDAVAADAAGMPAWIVGRQTSGSDVAWQTCPDFFALSRRLGFG